MQRIDLKRGGPEGTMFENKAQHESEGERDRDNKTQSS